MYGLVKKENDGVDIKVVLPMFISTTYNTTVFAFEGSVQGKQSDKFALCKDDDTAARSSYTKVHQQQIVSEVSVSATPLPLMPLETLLHYTPRYMALKVKNYQLPLVRPVYFVSFSQVFATVDVKMYPIRQSSI